MLNADKSESVGDYEGGMKMVLPQLEIQNLAQDSAMRKWENIRHFAIIHFNLHGCMLHHKGKRIPVHPDYKNTAQPYSLQLWQYLANLCCLKSKAQDCTGKTEAMGAGTVDLSAVSDRQLENSSNNTFCKFCSPRLIKIFNK